MAEQSSIAYSNKKQVNTNLYISERVSINKKIFKYTPRLPIYVLTFFIYISKKTYN